MQYACMYVHVTAFGPNRVLSSLHRVATTSISAKLQFYKAKLKLENLLATDLKNVWCERLTVCSFQIKDAIKIGNQSKLKSKLIKFCSFSSKCSGEQFQNFSGIFCWFHFRPQHILILRE